MRARATILSRVDSDESRVREVIQDRADEVEEPADLLARLRGAVARLDSEPSLLSAARGFRRRLPGDEKFGGQPSAAGRAPVEVIAREVTGLQPGHESVAQGTRPRRQRRAGSDFGRTACPERP